MIERLAYALGIDSTELFLKEIPPEDVIRSYWKAALEDIQWALEQVFKEQFREMSIEAKTN